MSVSGGPDLGVVRVTIAGKDVGLSKVMESAAKSIGKTTQEMQRFGIIAPGVDSAMEKVESRALAFLKAIVKQRNAADQIQDGFAIAGKGMETFKGETLASAQAAQFMQEQTRKLQDEIVNSALATAKAAVGTDKFKESAQVAALAISGLAEGTSRQKQAIAKLDTIMKSNIKAHQDAAKSIKNQILQELRLAQAQATAFAAAKDHSSAIQKLQSTLSVLSAKYGKIITQTTQYASAQAQLSRYQRQTDADSRRLNGTLFGAIKALNSYVGAFYALRSVFVNIGGFFEFGNQLEKTISTVRALSKTQERFNEIMRAAKQEQDLYGGSLQQTLTDFTGFIYLSNQTGIQLQKLIDISRRLSVLDPTQGMQGAAVALKEFFSGDIQSLSRRFEIDRSTLNSVKQLETSMERLQGLDKVLTDMGISQAVVTERAQLTAAEYDKVVGFATDFWTQLSRIATINFSGTAQGIGNVLEDASRYLQERTDAREVRLNFLVKDNERLAKSAVEAGLSYDQYKESLIDLNFQAKINQQTLSQLTSEQLAMAQSFVSMGDSTDDAIRKVTTYKGDLYELVDALANGLVPTINMSVTSSETYVGMMQKMSKTIIDAAVEYPQLTNLVLQYVDALQNNKVRLWQVLAAIRTAVEGERQKAEAMQTATALTQNATEKLKEYNNATKDSIEENIEAKIQSDLLSSAQELLAAYAQAAAEGLIDAKTAATLMANEFDIAEDKAYLLVSALQQIRQERGKASLIENMDKLKINIDTINAWEASGMDLVVVYDQLSEQQTTYQKKLEDDAKALQAAKDAQDAYRFSQMNTAGQLNYLRLQQAKYNTTQAEYWKILGDIKDLEEKLRNEQAGGTNGGGGESDADKSLKAAQDLYYDLLDIRFDYYKDAEKAEQEHQQKLFDIYNEFAKKQKEAERLNETDKRKSRASFYESLMGLEGVDTQMFSTQYEAAFAEAQRIAQEGKAALSKEFLALRQDQIDQMISLQKELADIQSDDKLTEADKQARIEYIQGLIRLYQEAHDEELKQLMEGGDANANQLQEQLQQEQQAYADQTQEIAKKASEQADAKVLAAERSKKALISENDLLRDQYQLIKNITDLKTKESIAIAPPISQPTPIAVPEPMATTPLSVGGNVNYVHDQVVNNTLLVIGTRLENKLSELVAHVDAGIQTLGGHLTSIDRGISRLPSTQLASR